MKAVRFGTTTLLIRKVFKIAFTKKNHHNALRMDAFILYFKKKLSLVTDGWLPEVNAAIVQQQYGAKD